MSILSGVALGQKNNTTLFETVPSSKSGVNFKNIITENAKHNALTYENLYNGGGVSLGDVNNDGLDDLYFVSNMQLNKLYLNLGNFKFKDITSKAGVGGHEGWKSGTSMVDINGDGLLDIYVCYSGKNEPEKRRNQFFINQGNLTFVDRAKEMGLDDPSYTTQCAFFDYDLDGDLDVFLLATNVKVIKDLEYGQARKAKHPYAGDKLFRNEDGKFIEVTEQAGIISNELGFGLGVAISDVNKDGWPDMYISNDYAEPDYLYINNKNGTFANKLAQSLGHISQFSMGSDIADVNNDSWPDIFTADMLPEDNKRQKLLYGPDNYEQFALMVKEGFHYQNMRNMLQLNNGNGTFSEIGQLAGISNTDWSWAPLFADFDNDGKKDLFVTNGYFRDYTNRDFLKYKGDYYFNKVVAHEKPDTLELTRSMSSTPLHNYIFRNVDGIHFENESNFWGFEKLTFSNGASYSDLDNDGDLDLIVSNQNAEALIYKNLSRDNNSNSFLTIQLKGTNRNTRAWGTSITAYVGGKMQYLEQMPVRGYQSSVTDKLHFGLGDATQIDSVVVMWPGGNKSVVKNVKANQSIEIDEAEGAPFSVKEKQQATVFSPANAPLYYRYREYGANDFKRQPLLTTMLSPCGPLMATADVNGDGMTDVFVGGTKGSPGKLFTQTLNESFAPSLDLDLKEDILCSDADALFLDADTDGDVDLYIVSGGYHDYVRDDKALQDRLYINDGKGKFTKSVDALPGILSSKSCVATSDFDLDGDLDLLVGGRVVPGIYPTCPQSYLLINNGKGRFTDMTNSVLPLLADVGMVTDAAWIDLNKDKYPDLLLTGEFMPIRVFINQQGKGFEEQTRQYFDEANNGLWNRLAIADFDHDGDDDFVTGNFGLNSQLKASKEKPLTLVYNDFDKNSSIDPILVTHIQGKPYPFAGRDELLDQIYPMRKKFTSYAAYADATLTSLFTAEELKSAKTLTADELRTVYFENTGSKFVKHALPVEAQYAPVHAIEILDYNNDGNLDLILGGNQSAIRIRVGQIDANYGQLYQGNGKGNFTYVPQLASGISLSGDVKSLKMVKTGTKNYLLAGVNSLGIIAFQLNTK
jgi:enediyne biosynthesis protein E4